MITPYTLAEWKDVSRTNEVAKTLRQIEAHLDDVLTGRRVAVFIFGGSGIGKNHLVAAALKRHDKEAVYATPKSFLGTLGAFHRATHRRVRNPRAVVFDEAELIFKTEPNLNVMKDATDDAPHALRYRSDFTWWEEDFDLEGNEKKIKRSGTSLKAPIIAMTNRNLDDLGRDRAHAEALFASRVLPINLTIEPLAVWEYVCWLALSSGLLRRSRGNGVSLADRTAVLDWFTDNLWNLKQVSVRTLQHILAEFTNPNDQFRTANLNLLLKPRADRTGRSTPIKPDWKDLRLAW